MSSMKKKNICWYKYFVITYNIVCRMDQFTNKWR